MFATRLDFKSILEWFNGSSFHYLMLFLPSLNPKDSSIEEYLIKNQRFINSLTGEEVAYIFMDSSLPVNSRLVAVNTRDIPVFSIRCGFDIVNDVSKFYGIPRYRLPALIVISKYHGYRLYSIDSERQLNDLFVPMEILDSYQSDIHSIKSRILAIENIDIAIENTRKQLNNEIEEITEIKEALEILKKDSEISQRISSGYCTILNNLKQQKGVKQKLINHIFESVLSENTTVLIKRLQDLGLSKELIPIAESFLSDMKHIHFHGHFYGHIGKVPKQIEYYKNVYLPTILHNSLQNEDYYRKKLSVENEIKINTPQEIEKLEKERDEIINVYEQKISNALLLDDSISFYDRLESKDDLLIEMLDIVYQKKRKINVIFESLDRQVNECRFDTFISCKSADYNEAIQLFDFLKMNGFKPFLADKTLRQIGTDSYGYLIRKVIDQCNNMIVYASKMEYLVTPYVSAEWNQFLDQQSSGYNYGHLYSIIPLDAKPSNLPPGLKTKQFFTIGSYKNEILSYLKSSEGE